MNELEKLSYIISGIKSEVMKMCFSIGNGRSSKLSDFKKLKELLEHLEEAEGDINVFLESDNDELSKNELE